MYIDWGTALQAGRSRARFPLVSLEFFIDIIFLVALWSWGWLSLWQKWVPGIFPGGRGGGGKGGRFVGLATLPPSCADSWNLGALTSWNPPGLSRRVMWFLYLPVDVPTVQWNLCSLCTKFIKWCLHARQCFVVRSTGTDLETNWGTCTSCQADSASFGSIAV